MRLVSLALLVLLTVPADPPAPLHPGDPFPEISAQTVAGPSIRLPAAAAGAPSIVLFAFSRTGGRDARAWSECIAHHNPRLPVFTVLELESVPGLFRNMALSGIRSSMPPSVQNRALLLFHEEKLWRARLAVRDPNQASVLLLAPDGRPRAVTTGPFSPAACAQFQSHLSDTR